MTFLASVLDGGQAMLRAHLEKALASYYHASELARNPLGALLSGNQGEGPLDPADLRALLREALETLRPSPQTPGDDPAWLPYRVVALHYMQSQPRGVVCEELAISQATFYRHRREALDAMTDYLWRMLQTREAADDLGKARDANALNQAVSAATSGHRERLHLEGIVDGVRAIVTRMPGMSMAALKLGVETPTGPVYGDPALLRQVLLNLITDALESALMEPLSLCLWTAEDGVHGALEPFTAGSSDSDAGGLGVARRLLEAVGGCIAIEAGSRSVRFFVPSALPPLILCLDDDADASRLYGIYLTGKGYRVRGVTTGDEFRAALEEEAPSAIVLDVLMPREDGWAILDELRGTPDTRGIPVVICSVLQQPDLALAMGAAAVLTKPVTPDDLLLALDEALAPGHEDEPTP